VCLDTVTVGLFVLLRVSLGIGEVSWIMTTSYMYIIFL